jgi:translation initiation factor IF-1
VVHINFIEQETMKKKNKNNNQDIVSTKEGAIDFKGIIEEALPAAMFRVACENNHVVLATLSGRLKVNNIRIVPGDSVVVEVSPYDLSRGRIVWRN